MSKEEVIQDDNEYKILKGAVVIRDFMNEPTIPVRCKYHTSWDWLMPVVEKIESIWDDFHGYFGVYISSNRCDIQGTRLNTSRTNPHYAYFNEIVADTKIQATWRAITTFIQWYNQQKQNV